MAVTDMLRGRQVIHTLTNKSGGSVAAGDVVVIGDGTNDNCFTTTTTASFNSRMVGAAAETIANNAAGRVIVQGYVPIINTNASVTRDHFLFTHTVAKEATGSGTRAAGAFGQVLETGADPEAVIWGMPDSTTGSETLAATIVDAKGDIITATAADTPARLAVGANNTVLTADSAQSTGNKWAVPLPSVSESIMTAAVTMTNAAQWYDGPSLSLAAGTWLVSGKAMIQVASASGTGILSRIYDGTTVYDATEFDLVANAGQIWTHHLGPVKITLGSTTTVKIQCQDQARTNSVILDTGGTGMPTDKGTMISAMQVAP